MRQFLLGAKADLATALTSIAVGQFAFTTLVNGVDTIDTDGSKTVKRGNIILGKDNSKGGNIAVPIYKNNFSFSKMVYIAATAYKAEFTITDVTPGLDYTVIICKKGIEFDERNKWSAVIRATSKDTVNTIAAAIAKQLNANIGADVTATATNGKIVIDGNKKGVDYSVVLGDDLFTLAVTETSAVTALADADYVIDLYRKAAADAGIEYTYEDANIYPDYPINPLEQPNSADDGFTIFTIRFAEPREMKTVDQSINQIVQLALPTGSAAIVKIEAILKVLAGGEVPTVG